MTLDLKTKKRKNAAPIIFIICCLICIIFGDDIKASIAYGIKLSVSSVIPSIFPFFVISDYLSKSYSLEQIGFFGCFFEKIFGIPAEGVIAFVLGNLCGFPLGVRHAAELYERGRMNSDEFVRLSGISNNPSLAFTVSVVGGAFLKDILLGIFLYLSVLLATVITGSVFSENYNNSAVYPNNIRQNFVLSDSIKAAGLSCVTVSSFIIFFSAVIGIFGSLIKNEYIITILSLFLEIGNGAALISECVLFSPRLRLALFSFLLGFSGISVHFQAFCYFNYEASKRKYLFIKITEAIIAFSITFIMSFFVL